MEKIWIRNGRNTDPESRINIRDPQHCDPAHNISADPGYAVKIKVNFCMSSLISYIFCSFLTAKEFYKNQCGSYHCYNKKFLRNFQIAWYFKILIKFAEISHSITSPKR
jgi:hypothetical protein